MTINERIRHFRKDIRNLNQRQFAADLGMAQTGVSTMEQNGATITDRTIKSICLFYNLNEDWLRYGIEPMYIQTETFSLDAFIKERGGTDEELEIIRAYFDFEKDTRKMLLKCLKSMFSPTEESHPTLYDDIPDTPEEYEASLEDTALKKDIAG